VSSPDHVTTTVPSIPKLAIKDGFRSVRALAIVAGDVSNATFCSFKSQRAGHEEAGSQAMVGLSFPLLVT